MKYTRYKYQFTKWDFIRKYKPLGYISFDKLKFCKKCKNCYDNGEFDHFNVCRVMCCCVDCRPLLCKGKDFERKNKP